MATSNHDYMATTTLSILCRYALTSDGDAARGLVTSGLVDGAARVDAGILLDHGQQAQGHVAELVGQRGARTWRKQRGGGGPRHHSLGLRRAEAQAHGKVWWHED